MHLQPLCAGWRFLPDPDSIRSVVSALVAAIGLDWIYLGDEPGHLWNIESQPSPHLDGLAPSHGQASCLSFLLNVSLPAAVEICPESQPPTPLSTS